MSTTGDNASTSRADALVGILRAGGQFEATPVENGLAVRVQAKASGVQTTVWLPVDGYGYAWSANTDHVLASKTGIDDVAAVVAASLTPRGASR